MLKTVYKNSYGGDIRLKKKIQISVAILGLLVIGILLKLFVIGEPVDGKQLAYNVAENNSILELEVSAADSAVALKGWKVEQKGNEVFISARKVLVSFLYSNGQYQTSVNTNGIECIYLGGQMIWSKESNSK